ncbi:hypothetical protein I7I48_04625 [Histoplasma ohiense]|nr:hypothetical protein I7I48_04625 [Histoplasma ohiense (nom. inval.)]
MHKNRTLVSPTDSMPGSMVSVCATQRVGAKICLFFRKGVKVVFPNLCSEPRICPQFQPNSQPASKGMVQLSQEVPNGVHENETRFCSTGRS